jgi:tetratricopeptide (TPR) repeat protein
MDAVLQDERLALELNLEGPQARLAAAEVVFEIASAGDGPALMQSPAALSPGSREGYVVAHGVTEMRLLPPGSYVARAKVKSGGAALGEVRRSFEVLGTVRPVGTAGGAAVEAGRPASSLAARSIVATIHPFSIEQVLASDTLGRFLDRIAERADTSSESARGLIERARTGDLRTIAVPDAEVAAVPAAAFVKGISLLAQNKLEPAAEAFRAAMRASADFYPAMVYLGACYAAGGNDRQAAGAWRTALIREGDTLALHLWLADAQLRSGLPDQALQTITGARTRWPDEVALTRRLATASLLAGNYGEGLKVVDDLIAARADDEPTLALAVRALYDATIAGQPVESAEADRARMLRLGDAYRARGGPSSALVDAWIAAANGKK